MNGLQTIDSASIERRAEINAELFNRFLTYLDAAPKTTETYTRALKQFFSYLVCNGISQPKRADILSYRDELSNTGHKPTTVQNYIAAVKVFFSWTAQEGLYPNVAERIKTPKIDREYKKDYLAAAQVKGIMETIERDSLQGLRDYAVFALMVSCGLRDIEVSRADIQDLRTVGGDAAIYIQGKGRAERAEYVKVPGQVEKAIRAYLAARGEANEGEPLFTSLSNNSQGGRLTTRSISRIIKTRLKGAGYNSDRLTAHSLRHTAVTLSLLAGKDITEVQQFARHANIATTMIYNHSLDKAKNGCSEAVANLIF